MKTGLKIFRQQLSENFFITNQITALMYLAGRFFLAIGDQARALRWIGQAHRTSRNGALRARCARVLPRLLSSIERPPPATGTRSIETNFGKRVMVLKAARDGEKGVLLMKFSELLRRLANEVDVGRLLKDYYLVIEPSWSGYFRQDLLYYARFDEPIFVLSAEENDYELLRHLGSNLHPVPLGPCDWVDPRVAEPHLGQSKRFDIVMNSNWGAHKRHYVLFRALRELPDLRALLIGADWAGGTRLDAEELARHYGVYDQLHIVEGLPFDRVMELTCQARMAILLSLKEGSNRALAEAMFCDVPVLLIDEHVGGIRKNVVQETGRIVPEHRLASAISDLLEAEDSFTPRAWAVENISCLRSTAVLNAAIRDYAQEAGLPWTGDLLVRSNSPEPFYYDRSLHDEMDSEHLALKKYLT